MPSAPLSAGNAATIRGLVAEDGMGHLFSESLLELGKEDVAPFIVESIRPQFDDEVIGGQHAFIEHGQDDRVDDDLSEFFHQIEG